MTIFVVHNTIGGYAREDAEQSNIVGVFTDETMAKTLARILGANCTEVTLNEVPKGYLSFARELGVKL